MSRLADPPAFRVLALLAVLVHKDHRAGINDRNQQTALVVIGESVRRDEHTHRDEP